MLLLTYKQIDTEFELQLDNFRRIADLCFRHLNLTYENYLLSKKYHWHKSINHNNPEFGSDRYLNDLRNYRIYKSEENSNAIAAIIFADAWLLSAKNFYRITYNNKTFTKNKKLINSNKPDEIAKELCLHEKICNLGSELRAYRNTIVHMVETDKRSKDINSLDFQKTYKLIKTTWIIYSKLVEYYEEQKIYKSQWQKQVNQYKLPKSLI